MRGRKPKPTHLKLLAGNPGKRPLNENEPVAPPGAPEPPGFLDAVAREEWNRMCEILSAMGILSRADRSALAAYCQAWSLYSDLVAKYLTSGPIIKTSNGNIIQNPILGAMNKADEKLRKWLVEFGMTPSSRTGITTNASASQNEKAKFFKQA